MSVINTNITSMIGQSNLNKSQNALQTSMERLSSGLRINSAKDDAAGQAIANRMTAQINGLAQAQRNANDGISIAQTTEGGLNQINDNLQRIRELSVQAANGTNSQNDLQSIQDEVDQRLEEINRISRETDFNGTRVLSEDAETLTIQVGSQDGQTIDVNLSTINSQELGLGDFSVISVDLAEAVTFADSDTLEVDGTTYTFVGTLTATDEEFDAQPTAASTLADRVGNAGTNTLVESDGQYYVQNVDGDNVTFYEDEFSVTTPGDGTNSGATIEFNIAEGARAVQGLTNDAAEVVEATANPLAQLDSALNQVDSLRSELGAVQNRFEDAITNLNTNETNLASARSRIEDADYAVEVANMTRAQILQQAGTSVLAQANQIPQNVLSLLG
ncbi:flagellin [Halomonas campaniensis]|uniref:Flagellin n=1 Tax=Halomonas campaniensis TaxID=213554 RepID=A0A7W5K635_9GAMM|nr:FliC/FljB family flagellin [Halomonas campaniensis]MBB3332523.1 flagellin [Halomonas campaniensis]